MGLFTAGAKVVDWMKRVIGPVGSKLLGAIGLILGIFAAGVKWNADKHKERQIKKVAKDLKKQLKYVEGHNEKTDDELVSDFSDKYTK